MTTTCNNGTYAMYEKNVRGFLATQFGLSVHPYADAVDGKQESLY